MSCHCISEQGEHFTNWNVFLLLSWLWSDASWHHSSISQSRLHFNPSVYDQRLLPNNKSMLRTRESILAKCQSLLHVWRVWPCTDLPMAWIHSLSVSWFPQQLPKHSTSLRKLGISRLSILNLVWDSFLFFPFYLPHLHFLILWNSTKAQCWTFFILSWSGQVKCCIFKLFCCTVKLHDCSTCY